MKAYVRKALLVVAILALVLFGFYLLGLVFGWWFKTTIIIWMEYGSASALYWLLGDAFFLMLLLVLAW